MTHYLDVKKQMLAKPTDTEVIEWLKSLDGNYSFDLYKTAEGDYNLHLYKYNKYHIIKESKESYMDCLKQVIESLEKKND